MCRLCHEANIVGDPCKRAQHCHSTIEKLGLVGPKVFTGFKLYATSANKYQHCCGYMQMDATSYNIVGPNNVGCCWPTMLGPFAWAFTCTPFLQKRPTVGLRLNALKCFENFNLILVLKMFLSIIVSLGWAVIFHSHKPTGNIIQYNTIHQGPINRSLDLLYYALESTFSRVDLFIERLSGKVSYAHSSKTQSKQS